MKIGTKSHLFALSVAAVSGLAVSSALYWSYWAMLSDLEEQNVGLQAWMAERRVAVAFKELEHDVRLLSALPWCREVAGGGLEQGRVAELQDGLAEVFRSMLLAKPHYYQARLIGLENEGRELTRVERRPGDGGIVRRADAELQAKGHRDYVRAAAQLAPAELHYSKIDLNREYGEIEQPPRPVLRVAAAVFDGAGEAVGLVVINLDFAPFARELLESGERWIWFFLANEEGYFLAHPDEALTFGFDLGKEVTVGSAYPELAGFASSTEETATARLVRSSPGNADLVSVQRLRPFRDGRSLIVGAVATFGEAREAMGVALWRSIGLGALLALVCALAAYALSAQLTRPIRQVTQAADRMAQGESADEALPLGRADEIGDLARSFQRMRQAVLQHEAGIRRINEKLEEANRDLEHFSRIASHELREPAQRVAGMASLIRGKTEGKADDDLLAALQGESRRMLKQIADFKAFAGIGKGVVSRSEIDLGELIEDVLEEFKEQMDSRRIAVGFASMPKVEVYPNLLAALYRELVRNALQHAKAESFELDFTAERREGRLVLGVRNTQSTIDAGMQEEVFGLFLRGGGGGQGTGVGLAICRRIVDRHGGEIWIESGSNQVHIRFVVARQRLWNPEKSSA